MIYLKIVVTKGLHSLVAHLEDLHETDIALILNQLRREDVSYAYRLLKDDIRPAVLADVDDEVQEEDVTEEDESETEASEEELDISDPEDSDLEEED